MANFNKILLICDNIFRTISLSQDYPVALFKALNSFIGSERSINLEHNFSKILKLNFIR